MKTAVSGLVLGAALALVAACGDDPVAGTPDAPPVVDTGDYHHMVASEVLVPTTSAQATNDYGLNIDGDPQGKPDNALGGVLALLAGQDVDIQGTVTESVAAGDIALLQSIRADDMVTDGSVSWQVFLGEWTGATPPLYDGTDTFGIAADSPSDAKLIGKIVGGTFVGGPQIVPIKLALVEGQPALTVHLVGTRIEADVTATSCTGKLGGAVTQDEVNDTILPEVHGMMESQVAEDCAGAAPPTCTCTAGSAGEKILELFDANADCAVTLQEVQEDEIISAILSPDIDLFNGEPIPANFNPRVDGVKDSVSLGLGITCVPATFTAPGEQ